MAAQAHDDEGIEPAADSIEGIAAAGGVEPEPTPPMQIALPGTENLISDKAGGTRPTSSEARLMGGSLPIEGQFAGEEIVTLVVEAKVTNIGIVYLTDKWGNTSQVIRRHLMRPVSVKRA